MSFVPGTYPDPIPGIIPFGTVTLFGGPPGVGKTAMLAEWIVRWQQGRTIWGHPTNMPLGGFYYIAADRQWKSHLQWFTTVGYPAIPHYSIADDPQFDLLQLCKPFDAPALFAECLNRLQILPGAHVMVDPVSPIFIAGNPNSPRDVARSMLHMSRECQQRQINLTATMHFSKQLNDERQRYRRPQDRFSGSGAFAGFTDTQIWLCDPEPPEQPHHVLGWNPRHQPPAEFNCARNEHGLFVPYVSLEDVGVDPARLSEEAKALWHIIPSDGCQSQALVSAALTTLGWSRATTYRLLQQLESAGAITRSAGWVKKRVNAVIN